jgi:hypothetical protein
MKQQKALFDARQQNIHFLHLPCNTLPDNKTYIVGCQCNTCKTDLTRDEIIQKQKDDGFYFSDTIVNTETLWNDPAEYIITDNQDFNMYEELYPVFDPGYDFRERLRVTVLHNKTSFE